MRVSVRVRRPCYYLSSEQRFTMTNAFLAFFLAKLCITLSKFTVFAMSVSMLSLAKSTRRPWLIVVCKKFFISFSLLKDCSAEATVAGIVNKIFKPTHTLVNMLSSLCSVSMFNNPSGLSGASPKLARCSDCKILLLSSYAPQQH